MATSISAYDCFSSDNIAGFSELNCYHQHQPKLVASISASNPYCHVVHMQPSTCSQTPLLSTSTIDCLSIPQKPTVMPKQAAQLLSPALSNSSVSSQCAMQDSYLASPPYSSPTLHTSLPPPFIPAPSFYVHQQQYPSSNRCYASKTNSSDNCFYWEDFGLDPLSTTIYGFTYAAKSVGLSDLHQCQQRRRQPKIHYCPICPHTSNRANNMKEHILTHDPSRPRKYACPRCGKRFARKHDMKRHAKSPHHP